MKFTNFAAFLALGAALVTAPTSAEVSQNDARVCGRVFAPSTYILQLEQMRPTPGNIVVAVSASETVEATVAIDGSFCFNNLHTDMHTIQAFGDGLSPRQTDVRPVDGKTLSVEIH